MIFDAQILIIVLQPVLKVASGNEINFSVDGKALDYKFDRVHGECEETLQIFSESVAPIIKVYRKTIIICKPYIHLAIFSESAERLQWLYHCVWAYRHRQNHDHGREGERRRIDEHGDTTALEGSNRGRQGKGRQALTLCH